MANRPDLDNLREKYPDNSLSKQKEVKKDTWECLVKPAKRILKKQSLRCFRRVLRTLLKTYLMIF